MYRSSLLLVLTLAGTAANLFAQATCASGSASRSLPTQSPFGGNNLYGHPNYPLAAPGSYIGWSYLIDVTSAAPITINRIDTRLFDDGGNVNTGTGTFVQPNQVGNTALVRVYTCATSYTGNHMTPPTVPPSAPWTLAGTGMLTVAVNTAPSIIDFAPTVIPGTTSPISIPPGITQGMAIVVEQCLPTGPNGQTNVNPWPTHPMLDPAVTAPASYTDGLLTLAAVAFQRDVWASGLSPTTHSQNIEVHYVPGTGVANWTSFGSGCEFRPITFYENFTAPVTAFDLANSCVRMTKIGTDQYLVHTSTTTLLAPTSTPLAVAVASAPPADDGLSAPINLPWTFNYVGGSTSTIKVGTNGFVYLNGTSTDDFAFYNSYTRFQNGPRLCPAYADWDLSFAGAMHYDIDPGNPTNPAFVTITWLGVEEWVATRTPPMPLSTFQIVMYQNGDVEYIYQAVSTATAGNNILVGFTPGSETNPPGLSAAMPFTAGPQVMPPQLTLTTRPILGTSFTMQTANIRAGTLYSILAIGFVSNPTGLNLAPYGMPNCRLYLQLGFPITTTLNPVTAGISSNTTPIPNNPIFNGINAFAQAAPLTAGYNAAGIFASNAVCLFLGLY